LPPWPGNDYERISRNESMQHAGGKLAPANTGEKIIQRHHDRPRFIADIDTSPTAPACAGIKRHGISTFPYAAHDGGQGYRTLREKSCAGYQLCV